MLLLFYLKGLFLKFNNIIKFYCSKFSPITFNVSMWCSSSFHGFRNSYYWTSITWNMSITFCLSSAMFFIFVRLAMFCYFDAVLTDLPGFWRNASPKHSTFSSRVVGLQMCTFCAIRFRFPWTSYVKGFPIQKISKTPLKLGNRVCADQQKNMLLDLQQKTIFLQKFCFQIKK